jgi:hypothetical protein
MGYGERSIRMIHRALAGTGRALLPTSDLARLRVVIDGPPPTGTFVPPKTWPSLVDGAQPLV